MNVTCTKIVWTADGPYLWEVAVSPNGGHEHGAAYTFIGARVAAWRARRRLARQVTS